MPCRWPSSPCSERRARAPLTFQVSLTNSFDEKEDTMSNLNTGVPTPVHDASYWTAQIPVSGSSEDAERMVVVRVRDFLDTFVRYKAEVTNNDGGLWMAMTSGLLLIPVAMAAFFYPMTALIGIAVGLTGIAAALLVGGAAFISARAFQRRHARQAVTAAVLAPGNRMESRQGYRAASILLAIFALAGTMQAAGDRPASYRVADAEVTIVCPLTVGGSFEAKSKDVKGEVVARADQPGAIDGALHVNLQTLATGIGLRDRHMRENYLEVQKGPEYATATLEQIRVERLEGATTLKGILLLHGQRREVSGTAAIKEQDGRLRVQAQFPLKVSEFEIPKPTYLGVGVRDEIQVKVNMTVLPGAMTQTASR
jgi:polyisoprenoid-binding protein YceI